MKLLGFVAQLVVMPGVMPAMPGQEWEVASLDSYDLKELEGRKQEFKEYLRLTNFERREIPRSKFSDVIINDFNILTFVFSIECGPRRSTNRAVYIEFLPEQIRHLFH